VIKVISFIGSGSLLTRAISFAIKNGWLVEQVFCPVGDSALPVLKKNSIDYKEVSSATILESLVDFSLAKKNSVAMFSINNRFLLPDEFLIFTSLPVFNIHNGLVQHYRGVAEVCVLAAICKSETEYGATLHQIQPNQQVDTGLVFLQEKFAVEKNDFNWLMSRSIQNCHNLFEVFLTKYLDKGLDYLQPLEVTFSEKVFSYSTAKELKCLNGKYISLGVYSAIFPKLSVICEGVEV
jgi:methionyl-tRNA formyltransferase